MRRLTNYAIHTDEFTLRTDVKCQNLIDVERRMLRLDGFYKRRIRLQVRLDLGIVGLELGDLILQLSVALCQGVKINETHHGRFADGAELGKVSFEAAQSRAGGLGVHLVVGTQRHSGSAGSS